MATPILIVCPECKKQIRAPESALGKKVRCKFCQAAFVARPKGGKSSPSRSRPERKEEEKPLVVEAVEPVDEDDEEGGENPYRLVDVSLEPRCPDCANEIDEGQVICLHCGYNLQTRMKGKTRKIYYLTFGQHFLWLLPGIACFLAVCIIIGFDVWYLLQIDKVIDFELDPWYKAMWTVGGIKLWVIIMSIGLIWLAGKFAVKRLILHPKPPEVEKLK